MFTFPVSYIAIFMATLAAMGIGSVWYSPLLFVNIWMKELGITKNNPEAMKAEMPKAMAGQFAASLVTAYMLAHFVSYTNNLTAFTGAQTGFWIWLGFLATSAASGIFFERRSIRLYAIHVGCHLVTLTVMGAILGGWPV